MAESLALYSMGSRAALTSLKRLVEDYERRLAARRRQRRRPRLGALGRREAAGRAPPHAAGLTPSPSAVHPSS